MQSTAVTTAFVQQVGATSDVAGCCTVTVDYVETTADGDVQLLLTLAVLATYPWPGDSGTADLPTVYLLDDANQRSDLLSVSGAASQSQPAGSAFSGLYTFAHLPSGVHQVRLEYDGAEIAFTL